MPISFSRKSKILNNQVGQALAHPSLSLLDFQLAANERPLSSKGPSCLVDLRHPSAFRSGFIPGSFSVPDIDGVEAARSSGLFSDREIYLLADHPEQLELCCEDGDLGSNAKVGGWFGNDAVDEWRRAIPALGVIETIGEDLLKLRADDGHAIVLRVGERQDAVHPSALHFELSQLPQVLDGLPVETAICLAASTQGIVSFASSLLWNFGFHKISCLDRSQNPVQCPKK